MAQDWPWDSLFFGGYVVVGYRWTIMCEKNAFLPIFFMCMGWFWHTFCDYIFRDPETHTPFHNTHKQRFLNLYYQQHYGNELHRPRKSHNRKLP